MSNLAEVSNVPASLKAKFGLDLHNKKGHPLHIIKSLIYEYFETQTQFNFKTYDNMPREVHVRDNFDLLLIPENHPARSRSDTYYIDAEHVLRTHTSAHQNQLLFNGEKAFLVTGDVYRKDEIDSHHYNVFHQMEGVALVGDEVDPEALLKDTLGNLVQYLFPQNEYRFNSDYFPFTQPSYEIEVKFGDKWLEILGCGVIHPQILAHHNIKQKGFAWGFGLERLAMIVFEISDIRLFWTQDPRFLNQFTEGKVVKFKPYSKVEPMNKDISFWLPTDEVKQSDSAVYEWLKINDFYEWVREVCGDSVELVEILDRFYHKKHQKYSITFRLKIGSPDDTVDNSAVVTAHANVCLTQLVEKVKGLGYVVR